MADDTMQPPPPKARDHRDPDRIATTYSQAGTTKEWSLCIRCLKRESLEHRQSVSAVCTRPCSLCHKMAHNGRLCRDMDHYPQVFTTAWINAHAPEVLGTQRTTPRQTGVGNPSRSGRSTRVRQNNNSARNGRRSGSHMPRDRSRSPQRTRGESSYRNRNRSQAYGDRYDQGPYEAYGPSRGRESHPLRPSGYGGYWRPEDHPEYNRPRDSGGYPYVGYQGFGYRYPDDRNLYGPSRERDGYYSYGRRQDFRDNSRSRRYDDQRPRGNSHDYDGQRGRSTRPKSPRRTKQQDTTKQARNPAPTPAQGAGGQPAAQKAPRVEQPGDWMFQEWRNQRRKASVQMRGAEANVANQQAFINDLQSVIDEKEVEYQRLRTRLSDRDLAMENPEARFAALHDQKCQIRQQQATTQQATQQALMEEQPESPSTSNSGPNSGASTPSSSEGYSTPPQYALSAAHGPAVSQQSGIAAHLLSSVAQSSAIVSYPSLVPSAARQIVPPANSSPSPAQQSADDPAMSVVEKSRRLQ